MACEVLALHPWGEIMQNEFDLARTSGVALETRIGQGAVNKEEVRILVFALVSGNAMMIYRKSFKKRSICFLIRC